MDKILLWIQQAKEIAAECKKTLVAAATTLSLLLAANMLDGTAKKWAVGFIAVLNVVGVYKSKNKDRT